MSGRAAAVVLVALAGSAAACGGTRTAATTAGNERLLTHAESVRLVEWARTFRSCMAARGAAVGAVAPGATRIDIALPPTTTAPEVLPHLTTCAERQGGPPPKTSLQYRRGRIVLYLPKRCLLDPKVAAA